MEFLGISFLTNLMYTMRGLNVLCNSSEVIKENLLTK